MWRRAFAAFLAWLLANVAAGAVVAFASPPLMTGDFGWFLLNGLLAGVAFGVAQWLALRPFLPRIRLWAPVTTLASPFSWTCAYLLGFLTLGLGGWLATGVSSVAQWVLLRRSTRRPRLSLLWIPANLIGGGIFYFCYFTASAELYSSQSHPTVIALLFAGSVGYALVTGIVVGLLVGLADRAPLPAAFGAPKLTWPG